jgi:hypothetical protein
MLVMVTLQEAMRIIRHLKEKEGGASVASTTESVETDTETKNRAAWI